MNTFMRYADMHRSVACLDRARLGKQRVEAFQILCALGDPWALRERRRRTGKRAAPKGWTRHPAVRMWENYEDALGLYYNCCVSQWIARGYRNTMLLRPVACGPMPPWFGRPEFHAAHRSNLLRKMPEHYRPQWPAEPPDRPYVWPA